MAGLITYNYAGVIETLQDDLGSLPASVTVGSPVDFTFTLDPSVSDSNASPFVGRYPDLNGAVVEADASLGSAVFTHDISIAAGSVDVVNSVPDYFRISILMNSALGYNSIGYILHLEDPSGTVFSDDSLPLSLLDPGFFTLANSYFILAGSGPAAEQLFVRAGSLRQTAVIQSVPEPPSVLLFTAFLGLLVPLMRRLR